MAEYIDREEIKEWIADWLRNDKYWHPYSRGKNIPTAEVFDMLSLIPAADVVSKAAYDQVAWERHLAEVQLKSIGKSLGEKMDDVQPVKHGRWIVHDDELLGVTKECSVCHIEGCLDGYYCPNCGARMDGEGNG